MNKNSASEAPPGPAAGPHPGLGQQTHKDGTPHIFQGSRLLLSYLVTVALNLAMARAWWTFAWCL